MAVTDGAAAEESERAAQTYDTLEAAEADGPGPRRQLVSWNEYEGPYFTARLGGGFFLLTTTFLRTRRTCDSKEQMTLRPTGMVRDFRLLLKGKFPKLPRLSYTVGYMYDAAAKSWRFRQTGLMLDIPEFGGDLFVGRTKEGFSTNKAMVGYHGWVNERSAANDAFLPILADGVKWSGVGASGKFVYNLGWFKDTRSENESFNRNDKQFAARGVWLPLGGGQESPRLLHLALEYRYGESDDGTFRFRSKPESFPAQSYAIDTGIFAAKHQNMYGVESYYRDGPWVFGMEYYFNKVSAPASGDPLLHGGEVFAAWLLTGETRPYYARAALFQAVSPARTVFEGGPGAWELVLRYSYADLDEGSIRGGRFRRITPMVNWHLSDNVRLEFVYGFGVLDRFGLQGNTQFFQTRLQLQM
ncbi:OprO/OprP family phosphate-selective porin [Steroidobacter cummioxidans]|uniref:OprO/OprP family phosphate-selective porin n=1 Tax=Steroidobacter cummioxidans TaxID=1803913 RepID=UPI0013798CD9|nr:porin [Steroidobacter cummioxidans]